MHITGTYEGMKAHRGGRDSVPKKEHVFSGVVTAEGEALGTILVNDIELLKQAKPLLQKGRVYEIERNQNPPWEPISIGYGGKLYYKKNNNTIILRNEKGVETNLSESSIMKEMGQALRAHNLKLKTEGKTPIKPLRRKW